MMSWSLGDLANLVTVMTAAGAVVAGIRAARAWRRPWSARPGTDGYSASDIREAIRWYVEPDVLTRDPSQHDEHIAIDPAERKPLYASLDRLLSSDARTRYVLLLGDSGMGKTSALINYYVRSLRKLRRPHRIAMASLTQERVIEWIRSRAEKSGTILLLDALDEYLRPDESVHDALRELAHETASFAKVVITCRSQYFVNDEDIPVFADVVKRVPRPAGVPALESIRSLYMAPLNNRQMRRYLSRRFPWFQWRKRRRARVAVDTVHQLSARPMLLSFLGDLQFEGELSVAGIYDQGVAGWLRRECRSEKEVDDFRRLSERLAAVMWSQQTPSIARDEAIRIASSIKIAIDAVKLSGRSLLNRDSEGRWKFAHRSIMEFLLIDALWRGRASWEASAPLTDQMRGFFFDRMRRFGDGDPPPFVSARAPQSVRAQLARVVIEDMLRKTVERRIPSFETCLHTLAWALFPGVPSMRAACLYAYEDDHEVRYFQRAAYIGDPIPEGKMILARNAARRLEDHVMFERDAQPTLRDLLETDGTGALLTIPFHVTPSMNMLLVFLAPRESVPSSLVLDTLGNRTHIT